MLKGKHVLLGVTGGIASYKIATLTSLLVKAGADVHVIMTKNATNFINPITFETLTGHKCITDTFDRNFEFKVEHVALAQLADIVMIAPATANVMAKLAHGLADDMLTTTVLASRAPKIIAPAMNTAMYENPVVQDNIRKLERFGYEMIAPDRGMLANGDDGDGRMPEPEVLFEYILRELAFEKDLAGKKVLVTAGATMEAIDPVRYITNHSSGKMGCAVAKAAMQRGAKVTLVAGHMEVLPPMFVDVVNVKSAADMFEAVTKLAPEQDIIVKAAAVADYTPVAVADKKIKKSDDDMKIELKRTKDILGYPGQHKRDGQVICGFSMETQDVIKNSEKKLTNKNCDMICANSLKTAGAGFKTDTNVITLITEGGAVELPIMTKEQAAHRILDELAKMI